jgi:NAD(P)-dependent dehydrogenase (short-subunit alcohol dehydrogenase family)
MRDRLTRAIGVAAFLAFLAVLPIIGDAQTPEKKHQQAVLVTGASTGIGRKITERLAADGYFVYAGARKDADLKALGAIKNVQAIRLDVTSTKDIDDAVATVTKAGRGLYGLVNNAGVASRGSFAEMRPEEFDLMMAVNVYGPYRVTKAFAPQIVAQKGRIITIGSISGILARSYLGAYAMTKHAIEAYTDSLAQQMADADVQVSVIEPGNYDSEITRNALKRVGKADEKLADRSQYKPPDEVAEAVEHALFEPNPKRRYLVVPNQEEAEITIRKQIEQLVQLNEGQPYTYDRDGLVKMLDDALAGSRPKTIPPGASAKGVAR